MKYTYNFEGLECANCVAKIERRISKIKGVESATIIFLSQRMIIHANESDIERIDDEVDKIVKKMSCNTMTARRRGLE